VKTFVRIGIFFVVFVGPVVTFTEIKFVVTMNVSVCVFVNVYVLGKETYNFDTVH
jgi:hypothetical protein